MTPTPDNYSGILCGNCVSLLNTFNDGIYISDSVGQTLMVNHAWEKLTGISASRVLGKNVRDLKKEKIFDVIVNPKVVSTRRPTTAVQEVNGRKVTLQGHPVLKGDGSINLIVTVVRDITSIIRLKEEISSQKSLIDYYHRQVSSLNPEKAFQKDGIIAVSQGALKTLKTVDSIASTEATVLILGETGVGKDVIARRIHQKSLRSANQFVKVDCSAISENLIESELFGYASGAFSGASTKGKQGFFELANKGTLFLDEIGELTLAMQTKLLRAIEYQEIIRVGSTKLVKIDVRIVAATNRNLEESVRQGTFRSDLFYRLKVAEVKLLPLRNRRDDILPLVNIFLKQLNQKYNKNIRLDSKAESSLLGYDWPGNIRELKNMIHGLVVQSNKSCISARDLPFESSAKSDSGELNLMAPSYEVGKKSFKEIVKDIERELINATIAKYGSISKASQVLKLDRSTIFRKTRGPKVAG